MPGQYATVIFSSRTCSGLILWLMQLEAPLTIQGSWDQQTHNEQDGVLWRFPTSGGSSFEKTWAPCFSPVPIFSSLTSELLVSLVVPSRKASSWMSAPARLCLKMPRLTASPGRDPQWCSSQRRCQHWEISPTPQNVFCQDTGEIFAISRLLSQSSSQQKSVASDKYKVIDSHDHHHHHFTVTVSKHQETLKELCSDHPSIYCLDSAINILLDLLSLLYILPSLQATDVGDFLKTWLKYSIHLFLKLQNRQLTALFNEHRII